MSRIIFKLSKTLYVANLKEGNTKTNANCLWDILTLTTLEYCYIDAHLKCEFTSQFITESEKKKRN